MGIILVLIFWVWIYLGFMIFFGCLVASSAERAELAAADPQKDDKQLRDAARGLLILAIACLGGPLWFLSKRVRQRWSSLEED
ncbi:MAG: hypothetical protein UW21_C0027G0006 [Candidatus Woesebacteria bacterium GW2011_GWB1_44_11b]|uniref:Uncharacterized protein n=1 Tax=Candidatus Woesebacteria bacterium GW2011_GWB1_44_11b TaxID=1618580 RepID=A0A0G1JA68_9BACT|nr:MAG: hypothetical protein UW21_C0027G0006 [Candidatus Woesebacteria bacterium GW2011_GWB1_44_11b]